MAWATYEYATHCTGGPQPGAVALMSWINRNYPKSKNWGIYNCAKIPGSSSLSIHSEGRALDVGYALVNGKANPDGYKLFAHLKAHAAELGIQGIIWDRKISTNRGDDRPYGGGPDVTQAHVNHLHIEMTRAAARSLTYAKISQIMGNVSDFNPGDDYFGGGEFKQSEDVTSFLSAITDLTKRETWIRVAMFTGGAIALLLGLVALSGGGIQRLTNSGVMRGVKAVKK